MNRTTRIYVRVAPEEKRRISERAKEHGYTAASLLREFALTGEVRPVPSINLVHWARLSAAVSNLNQSVRICNAKINAGASPESFPDIIALILQLKSRVDEIRADLKKQREDGA